MTDFDTTSYFNFDTADDFLYSVSGTLGGGNNNMNNISHNISNLNGDVNNNINVNDIQMNPTFSPISSGDESFKYNNNSDANSIEWNENTNSGFGGPINQDYSNSIVANNSAITTDSNSSTNTITLNDNEVFNDILQKSDEFQTSSVSTTSYSQGGITPESHPAMSSTHTSPDAPQVKKEAPSMNLKMQNDDEDEDEDDEDDNESASGSGSKRHASSNKKRNKVTKPRAKDKTSHNMIEKKYRTNINSKILALRDAVPSLRIAAGGKDVSINDLEGLTPASKLNKASVLTKATEYIKHLENKNEILKSQNLQLQRLIQEANLRPPVQQYQPPPQQQQGFGFFPPGNERRYTAVPINQSYSNENVDFMYNQQQYNQIQQQQAQQQEQQAQQQSQQQQQQQQQPANKFLFGGMAAVMGTSLFAGGGTNDFKSLGALPFAHLLPYAVTHPSPLALQIWGLLKFLLVVGSLATLIIPKIREYMDDKDKKVKQQQTEDGVWKTWLLVTLGFRMPTTLNKRRKEEILSTVIGRSVIRGAWSKLFEDYLVLSASEATFENCFLNLLIGKLLISKYPILEKVFNRNMCIKGSLILNLDYKGDNESLKKLNTLIGKIDGLSLLGSESLIARLSNLVEQNTINNGVIDGQNLVKYAELYQDNAGDFYGIVVNWRLLEIIHQLVLSYLTNLNDDQSEIFKDLKIIDNLVDNQDSRIYNYFTLFKTIVNSNDSATLLLSMSKQVKRYLQNFKFIIEGPELTDHELYNTSDEDEDETEENERSSKPIESTVTTLRSQKSLISSLGLVNEEQVIVLASSLTLYYYKNEEPENALKMLNYLKLSSDTNLTMLSFSSLITLINEVIPGPFEDNDILDNSIRIVRSWLNEAKFLDHKLRSKLNEIIVNKAMVLNGIEGNESEDE
ncbi:hypothetical protein G9P44_005650 [Scheffersomyces stipitis]|nr:hypothetical protein G9P44_005650 [Scheffersomyces stipitis]